MAGLSPGKVAADEDYRVAGRLTGLWDIDAVDLTARLNVAIEGRYRIERQLGEGGMATVYLARDLRHNRSVALKVLKPDLAAVIGAERFLGEIHTTASLQHPHILPLHDSLRGDVEGARRFATIEMEGSCPMSTSAT